MSGVSLILHPTHVKLSMKVALLMNDSRELHLFQARPSVYAVVSGPENREFCRITKFSDCTDDNRLGCVDDETTCATLSMSGNLARATSASWMLSTTTSPRDRWHSRGHIAIFTTEIDNLTPLSPAEDRGARKQRDWCESFVATNTGDVVSIFYRMHCRELFPALNTFT